MAESEQDTLANRLCRKSDKEPMKCNAFEMTRIAGTTLTPMFPYLRAGDIVVALSVFQGREDGNWGFFEHYNTVDEIIFSLGSSDGALIRSGEITSGARTHGVSAPIADHSDINTGAILGIIQRQDENDDADQHEGVIFRCTECNEELFHHKFSGRDNDVDGRTPSDEFFLSPYAADDAARIFNNDPALRKCKNCGHANAKFPIDAWGWQRYHRQSDFAGLAKSAMITASEQSTKRRGDKRAV